MRNVKKYKYVNDISSKFQQVQLGAKLLGEKLEASQKNGTGWTRKRMWCDCLYACR